MAIVRLQDAEQMTEETYNTLAERMGVQDRLLPALMEVLGELGLEPPDGPPADVAWEAKDLIKGWRPYCDMPPRSSLKSPG